MLRRLLSSTLVVALLAVALLGIPLGILGARLVRDEAQNRVEHEAATLALTLEEALEEDGSMTSSDVERVLPRLPRRVTITYPDGQTSEKTADVGERPLVARVAAPGGTSLVLEAPSAEMGKRVVGVWLAVAIASFGALAAAVLLALHQARRLSRPLQALARTSESLGRGDFREQLDAQNVPELAAVAHALNLSARRIAELVEREREFSANTSHQLRSSLTGIRLRIEAAQAASDDFLVADELEMALDRCDGLTTLVDDFLELARVGRVGDATEVSVDDLLRSQVEAWRLAFRQADRTLEIEVATPATVRVGPVALSQAVDVLIDNSLKHGKGAVRVSAREVGNRFVSIEVGDEGPGIEEGEERAIFDRNSQGDSGLGLSLARSLVHSEGGRLDLIRARPPVFAIFLPTTGRPDKRSDIGSPSRTARAQADPV